MNVDELLERRAERGVPRGAAGVWSGAQLAPEGDVTDRGHRRRSAMVLRVAILVWVLGLVAVGLTRPVVDDSGESVSVSTSDDDPDPIQSEEPLPAPLLVDGGTIKRDRGGVSRPFDPNFDGDDILDRVSVTVGMPDLSTRQRTTTVVFARPIDPYDGPILGVELLDGGGFRPWGVNIAGGELSDLTQHLERVDGDWSMAAGSGLVEVARFQDDPMNSLKYGWQFDFQLADDNEMTIQAETTEADHEVSEWVWIARLAGQSDVNAGVAVEPVDILGQDGFVMSTEDSEGDAGAFWSADGFVYRMTMSQLKGDSLRSRDSAQGISRLRIADRAEWVDAINASERTSAREWIAGFFSLVVLLASVASAVYFVARRSFPAAALSAASSVAFLFFVGPTTYLPTVLLAVVGLGLAWWLHRRRDPMPSG